jgi:capsular exopolysaccharide synthesis family protein
VQGSSAAQAKVRSYVDVATSGRVLAPVIADLGLDETPAALADRVSASSPPNTALIDLTVTDPDPATAAALTSAVAASFESVVETELESPDGGVPLVTIETLDTPVAATTPASPSPALALTIGALLGLLVGVAVSLLRRTLDTRIRGKSDVAALTDAPVLGTIGLHDESPTAPLVVNDEPRSPFAEAYRTLRTNLQFTSFEREERSFLVTSAMPSEGKSTTASNLAICLAETGASVLLVDADLRRPRIADVMGIEGAVGLTDLLVGRVEVDDVLQPWGTQRLSVLPSGPVPPNPSELLGSKAMQSLIEHGTEMFDFVVIDSPPLLPVTDAAVISQFVSGVIISASARRSTRPQLRQALLAITEIGSRTLGVVLTMVPLRGRDAYGYAQYGSYYGHDTTAAPAGSVVPVVTPTPQSGVSA